MPPPNTDVVCCRAAPQAHNGSVVFPRRMPGDEDFDGAALLVKAGLERGMRAGKLSIPEGVPFLLNVNDQSKCQVSVSAGCAGGAACSSSRCTRGVRRGGRLALPDWCCPLRPLRPQSDGACPCRSPLFSAFKDLADRDIAVPHFRWAGCTCRRRR